MTVVELISALEVMPFNAQVLMDCDMIEKVELDKHFVMGDPANPLNPETEVVRLK